MLNEDKHSKNMAKQKEIPKMYQTMSSGFKSQQPRFFFMEENIRRSNKDRIPGPGYYDTSAEPGKMQNYYR